MHALAIILVSILAAIIYGIIQDNITARICVEYFSVFHPHVIDSTSPTALAFAWGVLATWWVGLGLGIPLAIAARAGRWPKLTARQLILPLATVMLLTGLAAFFAGMQVWATSDEVPRDPADAFHWMAGKLPTEKHMNFWIDLAAHQAAYAAGAIGGILLWTWTLLKRRRLSKQISPVGQFTEAVP